MIMYKQNYKVVKELQKLYAWSQFYKENKREDDYNKVQSEITKYKKEHNINYN